jgi:bifunctional ADP-heptose synthase (sugar kinase/adenylyltransferase)
MIPLIDRWNSVGRPRVCVIGDLILDCYHWGAAERISPEAPVLVLRSEGEEDRLGGAASVASLLRGLECDVSLIGIVGDDVEGRRVKTLVAELGLMPALSWSMRADRRRRRLEFWAAPISDSLTNCCGLIANALVPLTAISNRR